MSAKQYLNSLQKQQTPFYFYDMELLRQTLDTAVNESSKYGYKLHYAIKANFDDAILEAVRKSGMGVDCVSGNEVRKGIESGFAPSEIVFAGVGKSDREIIYALEQNIFSFNCESLHELEVINDIANKMGKKARVALRINPDVDPQTHRYISTGKADNKFGISYNEVDQVIDILPNMSGIEIVGLHFHIGSQIREMKVFEYLCLRVNTIKEWFEQRGIKLTHINLGGGLGVDYENPDREPIADFASFFAIFNKFIKVDQSQSVHFELGRSLVAQCGELITRVLYNKKTAGGKDIVIVDGGMTELIRPALYGAKHKVENISAITLSNNTLDNSTEHYKYTVVGPVCESSDTFATDIELPLTSRGELISIRSGGAYGMSMASNYNMRDLPAAVYSDNL